jgi:hypothetical protein
MDEKGKHYAGGDEDRLKNFKLAGEVFAAASCKDKPKVVLWGYLLKHLTSIHYMCRMNKRISRADWDEKLVDAMNYLFLLNCMVDEELFEDQMECMGEAEDIIGNQYASQRVNKVSRTKLKGSKSTREQVKIDHQDYDYGAEFKTAHDKCHNEDRRVFI